MTRCNLAIWLLTVTALAGCRDRNPVLDDPRTSPSDSVAAAGPDAGRATPLATVECMADGGSSNPPPQTVLLSMGPDEVTFSDVRRAYARSLLLSGLQPRELAGWALPLDPFVVLRMAERVLADRRLVLEGEEMGLTPGPAEVSRAWQEHSQLGVYARMQPEELERQLGCHLGLGMADIEHLVITEMLYQRWLDAVTAQVDERALEEAYFHRYRTRSIEIIEIPNLPTSSEIEVFLADPASLRSVRETYQTHVDRYTQPESADVRVVRIALGENAPAQEVTRARQRIEELRDAVLDSDDMVRMSLVDSDDPARESGGLIHRAVAAQLPQAFQVPVGQTGPIERDERGFFFIRVEARYPSAPRPLDRLLEREIATAHLSSHPDLPGPRAVAGSVVAALGEGRDIEPLMARHHLVRRRVDEVRRDEDGMVPGVGVAPELLAEIFDLDEANPVIDHPVFLESSFFVVRLLLRQEPSMEEYQADRQRFEAEYRATLRGVAWEDFWSRCREEEPIRVSWPSGPDSPWKDR